MTNCVMHGANNAEGCRFDSQGKQELIKSTLSMQKHKYKGYIFGVLHLQQKLTSVHPWRKACF